MDDPFLDLGSVERLLLLEQQRVALERDTPDVERVARVREELAKVRGVIRRVVLGLRGGNESGDTGGGVGWSVVQPGEELGSLDRTRVDAGDFFKCALDECCHG